MLVRTRRGPNKSPSQPPRTPNRPVRQGAGGKDVTHLFAGQTQVRDDWTLGLRHADAVNVNDHGQRRGEEDNEVPRAGGFEGNRGR